MSIKGLGPVDRTRGSTPKEFSSRTLKTVDKNISKVTLPILSQIRAFIGEKIGKNLILSRQSWWIKPNEAQIKINDLIKTKNGTPIEFTSDKANLNGFIFDPQKESDQWIIVFNGMSDQYENHLDGLQKLAEDTGAHVLAFNYRGVGNSTGKAKQAQDLVEDGKCVLKYLNEERNIASENIMLYGHSMGGGVAAELHYRLKHQGPLLSESSFSTFAKAVKVKAGVLLALVVKLFDWDLDAKPAFNSLDKKGIVVNKRDPTVLYEASLYKKLKTEKRKGDETSHLKRVKVGAHPKAQLKSGPKTIKKETQKKSRTINPELTEYKKKIGRIKKEKEFNKLAHWSHDRLMDRIIYNEKATDENASENVKILRSDIKNEDDAAYKKFLELVKDLWN